MGMFYTPTGCSLLTVDWLGGAELYLIYSEDTFTEFLETNDLAEVIDQDTWFGSNGSALELKQGGSACYVITLRHINVGVVIHEVVHFVDMLFEYKMIPISYDNTETRAYMTDYMCSKIFDILGLQATFDVLAEAEEIMCPDCCEGVLEDNQCTNCDFYYWESEEEV